jgi:hypothetical protein
MARRAAFNDPIENYIEWSRNTLNPGHYLGGTIPPDLPGCAASATERCRPQPKKRKHPAMKRLLLVSLIAMLAAGAGCASRSAPIGSAELYWLLNRASWEGDALSVEMLLKAGADPDGVRDYVAFHQTYQRGFEPSWPINQAAWGGHDEVIGLLLRAGAKPHAPEDEGQTALSIAAERGHKEVVRLLLEAGADRTYPAPYGRGKTGTAEEIARNSGHHELARLTREFKTK